MLLRSRRQWLQRRGLAAADTDERPSDRHSMSGPTRVALVSDVHGNLPAFQAVLADIKSTGVDQIWNLGDLVGYGAQPDECVALAKQECDLCLIGNHDLVVIDKMRIEDFSGNAATGVVWTPEHINDETRNSLSNLSPKDESREMK